LQDAIYNSRPTSPASPPTRSGVIQIFNVGAERMLGYAPPTCEQITPRDISDPRKSSRRAGR
jgi:hypothetical protein